MIENKEKLKGLEIHVAKISEDKKIASAIFDLTLSKIDQKTTDSVLGGSDSKQTVLNKLQDKPEVFNFMRESRVLTKNKKLSEWFNFPVNTQKAFHAQHCFR